MATYSERKCSGYSLLELVPPNINKYPPEGHCSVLISSLEDKSHRMLSIGGARRKDERTWQDGAAITEFTISADDEDVTITSVRTCRTQGGTIPPLHGAAIIDVGPKFIMWGGLDLCEYRCRDDLLVIEELPRQRRGEAPLFEVTYVETLERKTPSRRGNYNPHQTGPVPSARSGHTLTKLPGSNQALLFGGFSMGEEGFGSRFVRSCKDGRFYLLDTETYEWQYLKVPLITARAFHSTTLIETESQYVLATLGGVTFEGKVPSYREPLGDIVVLTMDKELRNCKLQELSIARTSPNTRDVFLSSHATVWHNDSLIVVGGIQIHEKDMGRKAPKSVPTAYRINLAAKEYQALPQTTSVPATFATYGHTLHKLQCNSFLVVGGSSQQISVLTDGSSEAEPCD